MMRRALVLAAAQTVPVRGDVPANTERHLRLVDVAAKERAQVIVFPELSLTGYELDLARELAFTRDDPRLKPLVEAAVSSATTLVVGAPVRAPGGLSRLHIGAFILSPDGSVGLYTKHHLGAASVSDSVDGIVPPAEATVFETGDLDPLVHIAGTTAAVAVCADTGRPSHPQAAADRGARIYLASMFVIPSEFDREAGVLPVYAARHRMMVVFSNYGGPSGGLTSAGRSAIWSETGDMLARLEPSGAGVAVAIETGDGWKGRAVTPG